MDPAEIERPEGNVRWRILRAMFQALASQANWVGTLSNWALGTTGVYVGLLVANFDAVAKHLPYPARFPVFWFALISAIFGIVIQVLWGAVQFWINIENQLIAVALPEFTKPGLDPEYPLRIMTPVLEEFINSSPRPFRPLMRLGRDKGKKDIVMVPKQAASAAQIMFAFLVIQYIFLGVAVFWPLGAATLRSRHHPSQAPVAKVSVSPKQTPSSGSTWIP